VSARIKQILEVIEEVREQFQNTSGYRSIHNIRLSAVNSVAAQRGITNQSVLDKFIRQLRPGVGLAADFDKLLEKWLVDNSDELKNIMLKHISDRRDIELINNAFYKAPQNDILLAQEFGYDANEDSFREGKPQLKLHLTKERNHRLVTNAKALWNQKQNGKVICSVCSFSFPESYGKVGEGFIEAHHTQPIAQLAPDTKISIVDLVPICSNCHSMLHHHRPWLTIKQLHTIVSEQRK
jgi:hypothetical protein